MPIEPRVIERAEQPYVAIRRLITMQTFDLVTDRFPEVFRWLDARGTEPVGAPFLRFNVIDMERELEVEAGVPVAADAVAAEGEILVGVLPAGRYVTATHVGHPDELIAATSAVLDWAAERNLIWDASETALGHAVGLPAPGEQDGSRTAARHAQVETELLFRLAD